MKCSVSGCKREVSYVFVDAYLPPSNVMIREEISVFPMCAFHDAKVHKRLERLKAKPARNLSRKLGIRSYRNKR
jgi:hypothetical protein